jgi:hypothetical protein
VSVQPNDDLEQITIRAVYADCLVEAIGCNGDDQFLELSNQEDLLRPGQAIGDVDSDAVKRQMIRRTVVEHLDKELRLRPQGIKVLSLFFIDAVEFYRKYRSDGIQEKGKYALMFEEEYRKQDVIALFHELIGMNILRGFRFYGTSQSDLYDSVFFLEYMESDKVGFDPNSNRLGVSKDFVPASTEPKILEYKFEFESLVNDFEKDEKFAKHIDLAICWSVNGAYKERFFLQSLLVGDEGAVRTVFGATHRVFSHGSNQPEFELIVLEDLMNWLQAPADEEVRQKHHYGDA